MRSWVGTVVSAVTPIEIVSDSAGWIALQLYCAIAAAPSRTRARRLGVGLHQHDHELLAAEARDEVGVPHLRRQDLRGRAQHRVADRVREPVVDRLEVVEVGHRHGERAVVAQRKRELVGQPLVETPPVGEAGQRVLVRLALELVEQHRLLQIGFGERDVERVELGVGAGQRFLPLALDLGLASRGRDLELDLQRAHLVACRLRLHLALERVEPPEVREGGRIVARRLVIVGERLVHLELRGLQVVALAHRERGTQPLARFVDASVSQAQPAEREARVRDAVAIAGRFRQRERFAHRALRGRNVPFALLHEPEVVERGALLQRQAEPTKTACASPSAASASSSWPRFLRLMPMLLSVLPRSIASLGWVHSARLRR